MNAISYMMVNIKIMTAIGETSQRWKLAFINSSNWLNQQTIGNKQADDFRRILSFSNASTNSILRFW